MGKHDMKKTWIPNRKILSVAVAGLVALGAFLLTGAEIDADTQTSIVGLIMAAVGYFVPLPSDEPTE